LRHFSKFPSEPETQEAMREVPRRERSFRPCRDGQDIASVIAGGFDQFRVRTIRLFLGID